MLSWCLEHATYKVLPSLGYLANHYSTSWLLLVMQYIVFIINVSLTEHSCFSCLFAKCVTKLVIPAQVNSMAEDALSEIQPVKFLFKGVFSHPMGYAALLFAYYIVRPYE